MPTIRVQYLAQLRDAVDRAEEEVEISTGCTLAELLSSLAGRHGQSAAPHLVTPGGKPQRALLTIVNETTIPAREAATTRLEEGDIVTLMPPIAGG